MSPRPLPRRRCAEIAPYQATDRRDWRCAASPAGTRCATCRSAWVPAKFSGSRRWRDRVSKSSSTASLAYDAQTRAKCARRVSCCTCVIRPTRSAPGSYLCRRIACKPCCNSARSARMLRLPHSAGSAPGGRSRWAPSESALKAQFSACASIHVLHRSCDASAAATNRRSSSPAGLPPDFAPCFVLIRREVSTSARNGKSMSFCARSRAKVRRSFCLHRNCRKFAWPAIERLPSSRAGFPGNAGQ
jgi:hypothetical protein